MTATLDALLEPGERVLCARRGRSGAGDATVVAVIGVLFVGFFFLNDFVRYRQMSLGELSSLYLVILTVMAGIGAVALFIIRFRRRRYPNEILVTSGRVLLARWSRRAWLTTIPVGDITSVSWSDEFGWHFLQIECKGKLIKLPAFDDQDRLGAAISESASVEAPPSIGRFATADLSFAPLLIFFAASLIAIRWGAIGVGMIDPETISEFPANLVFDVLIIPAGVIGWLLAAWFGPLISATLMRPWVTAGQMRAGLTLNAKEGWPLRLALCWASVLYAQRLLPIIR